MSFFEKYIRIAKRYAGRILIITLCFVGIGVGGTLLMEKEYKATSQVIVTQDLGASTSVYASRRAAQAATETLLQIAYSDQFFNAFVKDNPEIKEVFPQDDLEKRRAVFRRDIVIQSLKENIISITTYNPDRELTLKENKEALSALQQIADDYFNSESGVTVRTINEPSLHEGIGRPNLWLNMAAGGVFGLGISVIYIAFETRKRLRTGTIQGGQVSSRVQ